jgi:hypothetical protein
VNASEEEVDLKSTCCGQARRSASRDIRDMYQPYICFVHNQDEKRDGRMFCFLCDFLSSFMINAEALKGASN